MLRDESSVRNRLGSLAIDSLYLPAPKQKVDRPICLVLHGKGDRPQSFAGIHDELGLADFDFLCLQGWLKWDDGYRWMYDEPRHKATLAASTMILCETIRALCELGYRSEQIYFLGHSQGGRVVFHFLLHADIRFGGAIGVSTYFPDRLWRPPQSPTPLLFTHGLRDRVIPVEEIRRDLLEVKRLGIPFQYREFSGKSHDFDLKFEMPLIGKWLIRQERMRRLGRALTKHQHRRVLNDSSIFSRSDELIDVSGLRFMRRHFERPVV